MDPSQILGCCHYWAYSSSLQLPSCSAQKCDLQRDRITVTGSMETQLCMHSEPGNSQLFWIRSATSAVAVTAIQHRSSCVTDGGPALPLAKTGLSNGKFGVRVCIP